MRVAACTFVVQRTCKTPSTSSSSSTLSSFSSSSASSSSVDRPVARSIARSLGRSLDRSVGAARKLSMRRRKSQQDFGKFCPGGPNFYEKSQRQADGRRYVAVRVLIKVRATRTDLKTRFLWFLKRFQATTNNQTNLGQIRMI